MSRKEHNYIYKTTCLITGKFYIGKHSSDYLKDRYLGSGLHIQRAIKKYGKQNFKREIIEICNKSNIDEREIYWIDLLDARNSEIGYNIGKGGCGGQIESHTEFSKNKISIANKGKRTGSQSVLFGKDHKGANNPNFGNHLSAENLLIISKANSNISEEKRNKLRIANLNMPKLKCPHCSKEGPKTNMVQHHFDKCKFNLESRKEYFICIYCGLKINNKTNLLRWHNDNCKHKICA